VASRSGKIIGFDELSQKLNTLSDPKEMGKALRSTVRNAMNDVKKVAAGLIPVGIDAHRTYKGRLVTPGFAKRSLKVVSTLDKRRGSASAILGVSSEAFYAIQFVELGTYKMAAKPWLRPAFNGSADKNIRKVAEGMREWIRGIADKHKVGVSGYNGGEDRASQLLSSIGE